MGYFESRVPIDINDYENTVKKLRFLEKLNFKKIILEPLKVEKISKNLKDKLRKEVDIDLYFRINLKPNSASDLKKIISKYNQFPDILSVESTNKEVQLFSARDTRIDIISFSNIDVTKTLTPGVISLSKQYNSFIEFSFNPMFTENKFAQSKNIHFIISAVNLALANKANYIISGNFSNIYDYRSPKVLLSFCQTLLDMPLPKAKLALRDNPEKLIEKIERRNDPNFIEEGVRLINSEKGGR